MSSCTPLLTLAPYHHKVGLKFFHVALILPHLDDQQSFQLLLSTRDQTCLGLAYGILPAVSCPFVLPSVQRTLQYQD